MDLKRGVGDCDSFHLAVETEAVGGKSRQARFVLTSLKSCMVFRIRVPEEGRP